jgi:hypothetical protein
MTDINPTRRTDDPPARDGAPLAGWPTVLTAEEAVALRGALGQLQTALDAVVRERDEARGEVERLIASNQRLHRALFRIAGKAPFSYADDPWTIAAKAMKREAKP